MDDKNFKITLIKALEQKANSDIAYETDKMWEVIMSLPHWIVVIYIHLMRSSPWE